VETALANQPPAPAPVRELWNDQPEHEAWFDEITELVRDRDNFFEDRRTVITWLRDAARLAFPADHEATVACEVAYLQTVPGDDGGFVAALELYGRVPRPDIAALVVKGAFTIRNYTAAEQYAKLAGARRALAGALLHQHRWTEGFAILDDVLLDRGPLFGGDGVTVSSGTDDPREAAIDEAVTIAGWASADVPEWVRAVGGMWERFAGDPIAKELEERFEVGLELLTSLDGFEVVIRQSRERSLLKAATMAARVGRDRFPDDVWISSVHGNLARDAGDFASALPSFRRCVELLEAEGGEHLAFAWMNVGLAAANTGDTAGSDAAFERAEALGGDGSGLELMIIQALRGRDPAAARVRALALFQDLAADPHDLAESEEGIALVELLLDLLIPAQDRQALVVQQGLIDAKLELWGECPSVWVERHNLGTVYAQLGEPAIAHELVTAARTRLVAAFGDFHPHVQLCDRTLKRLAA
jgi:hypothetical protein